MKMQNTVWTIPVMMETQVQAFNAVVAPQRRNHATRLHNCMNRCFSPKLILDNAPVKKVLQGTAIGDEASWHEQDIDVWTVPAISILTRLCFRMEMMTEMINGTFI
jgi:hypothetical protein